MPNLRGGSSPSEGRPNAETLRRDLDALLERMQAPAAREAIEALFRATAAEARRRGFEGRGA